MTPEYFRGHNVLSFRIRQLAEEKSSPVCGKDAYGMTLSLNKEH